MPIVVTQSVPQPPSTDAISPDGRFRATQMASSAGVFLKADYSDLLGVVGYNFLNPFTVTFWRQTADGVISVVRGGFDVGQYGAIVHAYDDEVGFGQLVTYWASAPLTDGTTVDTSKVTVVTWEPDGGFTSPGVWIKNLENPDLSVPARCIDWSSGLWSSRNAASDIWGGSSPAVTTDVRKSYNTQMQILTADEDEYQALLAAINASVVYIVGLERHRRRTGYYLVGDIAPSRISKAYSSYDAWSVVLTGMDRPKTTAPSLVVPGRSYADRKSNFDSYQKVRDAAPVNTPAITNLVRNPSFEQTYTVESSGFGANSVRSRVNTYAKVGSWSVQHDISVSGSQGGTNWNIDPVTGGQTVSAGAWVRLPATGVTALILWWRSGTTTLHATDVFAQGIPGDWARVSGSYTLAAGETCDRIAVVATIGTAPVSWWADAGMAVIGSTLPAYADGDSGNGWKWTGAANASSSRNGRVYGNGTEPY
jgi:hypothetical protein